MNVNLTPHLEFLVKQKVASGLYNSASEVVREALRLMEQQDREREIKLEQLRQDMHQGLGSGETTPGDAEEIDKPQRRARRKAPLASSHNE